MMYEGDTVRLMVNFKTFTGVSVDPTTIKLNIIDGNELYIETFNIGIDNKLETGKYFYDYTPSASLTQIIFEFSGVYNNKPILSRGKVDIKFI